MTTPFLFADSDGQPLGSYRAWETEEDRALWNLQLRRRAYVKGFEISPWRWSSSGGGLYILGWTNFRARGETVVEWLEANMALVEREGVGDLELFEGAWRFYCVLHLTNRIMFKVR